VFDNGYVNTFVGTEESTQPACNIVIDMTDLPAPTTTPETEAYNRIRGQRISKTIADLFVKLRDNTRDYNEYNFLRAVDPAELLVVYNAERKNEIINIDLPMVYNNGTVQPVAGTEMPEKYFGTRILTAGTSNGAVRSLVERWFSTSTTINAFYVRAGEIIPTGGIYQANEAYDPSTADSFVCKILSVEGIPFMSSFEVGTAFFNARSLTENHYLTRGYNTLQRLKEKPFISVALLEN